ncbi:hypothetical protein BGLY_2663 [Bacillus glycinifermentans]|nr:hypothetical protein BGLY_2663 [Bacillus glycinifermentans]
MIELKLTLGQRSRLSKKFGSLFKLQRVYTPRA